MNGKFHGQYNSAAAGKYIGQFKKGKFDGYGVYTPPVGKKIEGIFKDGKMAR